MRKLLLFLFLSLASSSHNVSAPLPSCIRIPLNFPYLFSQVPNIEAIPTQVTATPPTDFPINRMSRVAQKAANTMSKLPHAKIVPRRSSSRGHANHGWLNTYHTFSFASYYEPAFETFGSLRVLNEDRVAPQNGFPTHPHRDAEIFSYILSGELTHRDSMVKGENGTSTDKNDFYRMHRGDVQFTTGGTGIAHSEQNEHKTDEVHFLQIWALPWRKRLPPTYHTMTFPDNVKQDKFATIISPLKAGPKATPEEEKAAVPTVEGTIPIHADMMVGAGIIQAGKSANWRIGGDDTVRSKLGRHVYVHVPMCKTGAKIQLGGQAVLEEGDGAFVSEVNAGDELLVESIGNGHAEVVVLDSD